MCFKHDDDYTEKLRKKMRPRPFKTALFYKVVNVNRKSGPFYSLPRGQRYYKGETLTDLRAELGNEQGFYMMLSRNDAYNYMMTRGWHYQGSHFEVIEVSAKASDLLSATFSDSNSSPAGVPIARFRRITVLT